MKNIFVSKVTDLTYGHPGNDRAWPDVHRQVVIVRDPIGPCIILRKHIIPLNTVISEKQHALCILNKIGITYFDMCSQVG